MFVTFHKLVEQRVVTWEGLRGRRTRVPGATMALGRPEQLSHDLVQLVVEGALGIERGFWGSVASGATFKSTKQKRTRAGRAVIADNRQIIKDTEQVVHEHVGRWRQGEATPAATHLDELTRRWSAMGDRDSLTIEWPTLHLREEPSRP